MVSLDSMSIPKTIGEVMSHLGWQQAMINDMVSLHSNDACDLVHLLDGKTTVNCRWVYTVKIEHDGKIYLLKAHLVEEVYKQIFGLDYGDTLSLVVKITFVHIFHCIDTIHQCSLYQLDIKKKFVSTW